MTVTVRIHGKPNEQILKESVKKYMNGIYHRGSTGIFVEIEKPIDEPIKEKQLKHKATLQDKSIEICLHCDKENCSGSCERIRK